MAISSIDTAGTLAPDGMEQPTGTTGTNDPQINMYAGYRGVVDGSAAVPSTDPRYGKVAQAYTTTARTDALTNSLSQNIYDPWGPGTRPDGGREYTGPWINPWDTDKYSGATYRADNGVFKYNQMLMTVAQNFDPFMQKKEATHPHWWLNRIPRTAYKLFDGTVHETRIYRGGLSVYSGLSDWEDMAPDPTQADACAPMKWKSYSYAWETRAWSGKKTAWGSDPVCLDIFKFTPHAIEQLGWILETGVKFGTDIQNIWNRDMFIYHSVMAGRSYVMTSQYRGAGSPRYIYEPYCKFVEDGQEAALKASKAYVDKPFVVIDASSGVEPVNFDVLDIFRRQLERQCPEAAVGRIGNSAMFAIAMAEEDVEHYIRGNEEERRYWIEANPQALINHYGFAPTTFRRWTITCDGDQLRFKYKRYIAEYTDAEAKKYGYVGYKELMNKPVYIAQAVDPEYAGRPGINGSPVPEANPEYDLAELAIAPIFMNQVFTNQFVPDVTNLGHGTYFGPKKGLNGKWAWYNIQSEKNPDMKVGNFKGEFEIVPKPELCAIYASSFIYRRCAEPLPSLCPAENPKINVSAKAVAKASAIEDVKVQVVVAPTDAVAADVENGVEAQDAVPGVYVVTAKLTLDTALLGASAGEQLKFGDTGVSADVFESLTGTVKNVQLDGISEGSSGIVYDSETGTATVADAAITALKAADITVA